MRTERKDVVMNDFVGVMAKLKAVIEAENDFLSRGLPASLLDTTEAKSTLSDEYVQLGGEVAADKHVAGEVIADPALSKMLVEASATLYALSEENCDLLEGALHATRRRVDAVMEAVRACKMHGEPTD
jgi:hypothetical protein